VLQNVRREIHGENCNPYRDSILGGCITLPVFSSDVFVSVHSSHCLDSVGWNLPTYNMCIGD